ncbi:MAG: hypothetical protein K0R24_760 [Gammaproteobacteria bacterium]|jgi:hypothetical protein|nr:hypothetical protein [Gammaproteobacteria bacterium]
MSTSKEVMMKKEAKPQASAAPAGVGFSYMNPENKTEIDILIAGIRKKLNRNFSEFERIGAVLFQIEIKLRPGIVLTGVFEQVKAELNRINKALDPELVSDEQGERTRLKKALEIEPLNVYIAHILSRLESGILSSNSELFDEETIQAKGNTELARSRLIDTLNKVYEAQKAEREASFLASFTSSSTPLKIAAEENEPFRISLRQFGIVFDEQHTPPFSSKTKNFWVSLNKEYNLLSFPQPEGTSFSSKNEKDKELEKVIQEFNDSLYRENILKIVTAMKSFEVEFKMFSQLGDISSDLESCDANKIGQGQWSTIAKSLQDNISSFARKGEDRLRILQEEKGRAVKYLETLKGCLTEVVGSKKEDKRNKHSALVKTIVGLLQYKLFLANNQTSLDSLSNLSKKAEEIIRSAEVEIPFDEELLIDLERSLLNLVVVPAFISNASEVLQKAEAEFSNLVEKHKNRSVPLFSACAALSETKDLKGIIDILERDKNLNKEERFLIVSYLQAFSDWRFDLTDKGAFTRWAKDFIQPLAELAEAQGKTEDPLAKAKALTRIACYASVPFSEHTNIGIDTASKIREDIKTLHAILDKMFELHKQYPFSKEVLQAINAVVSTNSSSAEEKNTKLNSIHDSHHHFVMHRLDNEQAILQTAMEDAEKELKSLQDKISADNDAIANLDSSQLTMNQELKDSADRVVAAESSVREAHSNLGKLKEEEEQDSQRIKELEQEKNDLELEQKVIQNDIEVLKGENEGYLNKKGEYEKAINDLKIEIDPVQDSANTKATKIIELDDDLATRQAETNGLNLKLKELQEKIFAKQEELKVCEQQKTAHKKELENIVKPWHQISSDIDNIIEAHRYLDINYRGIGSIFGFNKKDKALAQAFSAFKAASAFESTATENDKSRALWVLHGEILASLKRKDLSKERRGTLNAFLNRLDGGDQRDIENCQVSVFKSENGKHSAYFSVSSNQLDLRCKVDKDEKTIKGLQKVISELKTEKKKLEDKHDQLKDQISTITNDKTTAEKQKGELTRTIDELTLRQEVIRKELKEFQDRGANDSKVSMLAQKAEELKGKGKELSDRTTALEGLSERCQQRKPLILMAQVKLTEQEDVLATAQGGHEQKSAKQKIEKEAIEKKRAELSDKITQNEQDVAVVQEQINDLQSQAKQLATEIVKFKAIGQPISTIETEQTAMAVSPIAAQHGVVIMEDYEGMRPSVENANDSPLSPEAFASNLNNNDEVNAELRAFLDSADRRRKEKEQLREAQEQRRAAEEAHPQARLAVEEVECNKSEEKAKKKQEMEKVSAQQADWSRWSDPRKENANLLINQIANPQQVQPAQSEIDALNVKKEGMRIVAAGYHEEMEKCEQEFNTAVSLLKQNTSSEFGRFSCDPDTPENDVKCLDKLMEDINKLPVQNESDLLKLEGLIESGRRVCNKLTPPPADERQKGLRKEIANVFRTKAPAEQENSFGHVREKLGELEQARKQFLIYANTAKEHGASIVLDDYNPVEMGRMEKKTSASQIKSVSLLKTEGSSRQVKEIDNTGQSKLAGSVDGVEDSYRAHQTKMRGIQNQLESARDAVEHVKNEGNWETTSLGSNLLAFFRNAFDINQTSDNLQTTFRVTKKLKA